jgi:hypothetical protein
MRKYPKRARLEFPDTFGRRVVCEYSTEFPKHIGIKSFDRETFKTCCGSFLIGRLRKGLIEALHSGKDIEIKNINGIILARFPVYLDSLFVRFLEEAE